MRPLDVFMEKQLCDRTVDSSANRAMSREVNDLCRKERALPPQTLNLKDKATLASAGLLIGSPLMLFGLGATFAFCDDMDYRQRIKGLDGLDPNRERVSLRKGAQAAEPADGLKAMEAKLTPLALLSLDLGQKRRPSAKKSRWDMHERNSGSNRPNDRQFLASSSSWLEASKLVKKKQFLLDSIERVNKGNQLSTVSRLLSQIEVLDKALKRMGC